MANNALTYGFVGLESDLYAQRINTIGIDRVFGMIADSVAEYNRVVDAMMAGWVSRTTMVQEYIELAGAGTLQPLTPDGNPLPVIPSGNYSVGYPLHGAGTGFGTNRITRPFLTGEEADRFTNDAFIKDADWRMRHLLASILDSSSWTYTDRYGDGQGGSKGIGNVTVQPLANGDSVTYMTRGGAQATDNHYLFQAAGIADATNPFAAARAEFVEVNDPDVAYLNRNNLPAAPYAPTTILGPGDEILGKLQSSNMWIVEWGRLPTNIFVTVATGAGPFVRMREIADASLQGLFTEGFDVDGNHMGQRFLRWAGFGVANRVAATATLVGAGAYTTPTLYDAPLPI